MTRHAWRLGILVAAFALPAACGGSRGGDADATAESSEIRLDAETVGDLGQADPEDATRIEVGHEIEATIEAVDVPDEPACAPACDGRTCGPDGCGGVCGTCATGETCDEGVCERPCQTDADCTDRQACAAWEAHATGHCVDACVSACPAGLGLQAFDGCHCRAEPPQSRDSTPEYCLHGTLGFDGYLRVVDQGNGVLHDLRSGLLWTAQRAGVWWAPLSDAPGACAAYALGGLTWRLPTVDEVVQVRNAHVWTYFGGTTTEFDFAGAFAATLSPGEPTLCTVEFTSWPSLQVKLPSSSPYESHPAVFCVTDEAAAPVQTPTARFVPLHDNAVGDRVTGLAWSAPFGAEVPGGPWASVPSCDSAGAGWRTPTFKEVATLWQPMTSAVPCAELATVLGLSCPLYPIPAGTVGQEYSPESCHNGDHIVVHVSTNDTGQGLLGIVTTAASNTDPVTVLCVRALADGDGIPGSSDDCPGIPDPSQADGDADGVGAACDPDEAVDPSIVDICENVSCGVFEFAGWPFMTCGTCPAPAVCAANACVEPACSSDADCQGDADALPGGTLRRCNPDTHACELGIDDHAEVLDQLQRIYRGAAIYYSRADRLTDKAAPVPCQFPASQGVTPIEGTCCYHQGGPDKDGNDLCDADPSTWNDANGVWASMAARMVESHAFTYSFASHGTLGTARFTASAYGDLDCDTVQSTFQALGFAQFQDEPCAVQPLETLVFNPESVDSPFYAVHLTPAQRAGFMPPPGTVSLNPFYDEAAANLAAILDGAVAYYEAQPPDACAFPSSTWVTPIERTCCPWQGGPDQDGDYLCDPDPLAWQTEPWLTLGFSIETEHAFVYKAGWDADANLYRASAYADLDCDTIQSTFVRFARPMAGAYGPGASGPARRSLGEVGPARRSLGEGGCDAEVVPGIYIENETE